MKRRWLTLFLFLFFSSVSADYRGGNYQPLGVPKIEAVINYQAKDFSPLIGKMKGFSDSLLSMHFKLYQGYVKNSNELAKMLKEMRQKGQDKTIAYGALIRRFAWEFDGMFLHELYFENLGGTKPLERKSHLHQKLEQDFGSFEAWQQNFMATGLIRGIGWVILYQDPIDGFLHNIWIDEHNINHIPGGKPILVMDVWEHAYITEYGLDRSKYIEAFFNNVDWDVVSKRFLEHLAE